jgi:hypothetical protein
MAPIPRPRSVNQSKKERQSDRQYARGGKTPMFKKQAAGTDRPGNTGKDQSSAPGAKFARGGREKPFAGGFAKPAKAGATGPC